MSIGLSKKSKSAESPRGSPCCCSDRPCSCCGCFCFKNKNSQNLASLAFLLLYNKNATYCRATHINVMSNFLVAKICLRPGAFQPLAISYDERTPWRHLSGSRGSLAAFVYLLIFLRTILSFLAGKTLDNVVNDHFS